MTATTPAGGAAGRAPRRYYRGVAGCLSENTIQGLVSGWLSGDPLGHAQVHLETCADCRTLVIELARDRDLEEGSEAHGEPGGADTHAARQPAQGLAERFAIVRPLGRGGMGVVYEALDRERGARVAVKTLQHVTADSLLRFKTEFRAVQDVQHPNLVTLGELLEDRGQWWLTMELVDGRPFLEHVRPGGRLDEHKLRAALRQLAAALHALHAHGLVHRDVKPHNVLVTDAGRVVLLDFGLVADVAQSESNVVGTPAYMAPEQGLVREIGPAADWYGVGALLYEALTGALPFQGAPLQVLIAKQHELPRRPGELASVPDDLDALCMQLLAIEPAPRLNAAAALAALDPGATAAGPPVAHAATPAFVGRQRELADLADAFAATRAGAEAIVLVEGESGIGKSALVARFLDDLHRRAPEALVLAGRCYERETVPYKGLDGVVDTLARYLRKLPEADTAAVLPRRAGLLVQAFPVLGKVTALRRPPADDVLDPVELRTRAFAALRELLGRLAEHGPLVIWIDDLQWADADSLELLAWLMGPPEAPPLLLLLTSRPPGDASEPPSTAAAMARVRALPRLRRIALARLPRDEAVALAAQLLAAHPATAPTSAALVAEEAGGHPLFIDALVRHTELRSAPDLPLRLSDALWARIAELDPPARQLLALAAVAGWPLSPELLASAASFAAGELDPALARLRQAHLARISGGAGKRAVEPYHDRVREAVLANLDPELRRACHRALARALLAADANADGDGAPPPPGSHGAAAGPSTRAPGSSDGSWGPEAVATHLHAAGELEQAARYMVKAADQAAAALAFDRAARLYRQALELHDEAGAPGPLGDTRDVRARLARVLVNACRGAEAAAIYLELARVAAAAGEEDTELRLRGAEHLLRSGHWTDGWRALAAVLDELDLRPPSNRASALWRLLWRRAWVRVRGLRAIDGSPRAAELEAPPGANLRLEACRVAALSLDDLDVQLGAEYTTRYQVLALRTGDPRSTGLALVIELSIAMSRGVRTPRSARLLEVLAATAAQSGDPRLLGLAQCARSFFELALGRWARGHEHALRAAELFRERCLGASTETTGAVVLQLLGLFYAGELRDFTREQQATLRQAEERADHFTLGVHAVTANMMWLLQDQPAAARQQVERGLAPLTRLAAERKAPSFQRVIGQSAHVEIDLYEGDGAAAYRRIDQAWRRTLGLPFMRIELLRGRMLTLHGLAALAACRPGEPERRLVRAAARDARDLRAMRMPWTDALARVVEAGCALATGARERAREQLERAAAELAAAGMPFHATLARRRLGELEGGAEGVRAIAEADAWLAAQDVRAPERLARSFMPAVP